MRGEAARKAAIFRGRQSGNTGQKDKRPVLPLRALVLVLFIMFAGFYYYVYFLSAIIDGLDRDIIGSYLFATSFTRLKNHSLA